MVWSLYALCIGFCIDLIVGDPHGFPHPVVGIGRLISLLERLFRRLLPKTKGGEIAAGACIWVLTVLISAGLPAALLYGTQKLSVWLRLALESVMCWQILATKSLRDESMKVFSALRGGTLDEARQTVSMIVGRDTAQLDEKGVARAAVETVAENTSDGVIAPLLFLALGGAPLGFFYKAVNTMDSMLGYVEMPYKNIGLIPAKLDDVFNFIPARLSAFLMLAAGALLRLDVKNGWRIFRRDRCRHASPNSAQTESVCAGLLGLRLAGDAWYHGVLHRKSFIGDAVREIETDDIPRACRLMTVTALLALVLFAGIKALILLEAVRRVYHGTEYYAAGNHVQRRQEPACRGTLPDLPAGRLSRRAVQKSEYGAQFLYHGRRRRNGPRAGRAGGGRRDRAGRPDEPDPPEADDGRRQSGHRERAGAGQHARDGILPP